MSVYLRCASLTKRMGYARRAKAKEGPGGTRARTKRTKEHEKQKKHKRKTEPGNPEGGKEGPRTSRSRQGPLSLLLCSYMHTRREKALLVGPGC